MKVNKPKPTPKAARIFTDREEPRKIFWDAYNMFRANMDRPNDIKVINYYGIGGIGKTTLLKQLAKELKRNVKKPYYLYIDFGKTTDTVYVLKNMRNRLQSEYKFRFPIFDVSLYVYMKKIGEDAKLNETRSQTEQRPVLGALLELSGLILDGMAAVLPVVAKSIDSLISYLINKYENRKAELYELQYEDPDEILANLPYYFAGDLANNLKGLKEPFVVFLDTYEALVNELAGIGNPLNNDDWLRNKTRGLIANVPNVLWVIAGRDKMKWVQLDGEWKEAMDQHLLGNLSLNDSRLFLQSAGITDQKLIDGLYALTGGVPVYLDIVTDRYEQMISRGETPDMQRFGGRSEELVERFVRYLDDSKKDLMYLLSCLDEWTDELLAEVAGKLLKGFSYSTIRKVKGYSFISTEDNIHFRMHKLIATVIQNDCRENMPDLSAKVNAYMESYYLSRLEAVSHISSSFTEYLRKYLYYKLRSLRSEKEFCDFLLNQHNKYYYLLKDSCQYANLCRIQYEIAEHCTNAYGSRSIAYAAAYRVLYDALLAAGRYPELPEAAQKSYDSYRKVLGENHIDTVSALSNLGRAQLDAGSYGEAAEIFEKVLRSRKSLLGDEHPDTIDTMNSLAETYGFLGKYKEALAMQQKVVLLCICVFGANGSETLSAMNNLANCFNDAGRYREALEITEKVYNRVKQKLGEEHLDTIRVMENLAIRHYMLGKYKEALDLFQKVFALRTKLLGEEHPDTISAMGNLASAYGKLANNDLYLELSEKALELSMKVLGGRHPRTIAEMNNVIQPYMNSGRLSEAVEMSQRVLSIREDLYGPEYPDTISSLANLALCKDRMGMLEESAELFEKVLKLRIKTCGNNHPDTIDAMHDVAIRYNALGRYKEAMDLMKQVLAFRKEHYGEEHPDTISAMNSLAMCFRNTGDLVEARKLAEQASALSIKVLGADHPMSVMFTRNLNDLDSAFA